MNNVFLASVFHVFVTKFTFFATKISFSPQSFFFARPLSFFARTPESGPVSDYGIASQRCLSKIGTLNRACSVEKKMIGSGKKERRSGENVNTAKKLARMRNANIVAKIFHSVAKL